MEGDASYGNGGRRDAARSRARRSAKQRPGPPPIAVLVVVVIALLGSACDPATDDPAEGAGSEAVAEGWVTTTVPDEQTGGFELAVPEEAAVWRVGEPLAPLAAVADGSDWWYFWEPRLGGLTPEVSNVRAMAAIAEGDDLRSVQVNVAPYDLDADPDDASAIAEAFEVLLTAQGSEVRSVETVDYDGPEVDRVAQLVHRVDPDVLDREVWQRFYPVPDEDALWSVQCDAPAGTDPRPLCARVLDAFRPPAS